MPHRYTLHTAAQLHGFRRTRAIIRLDLYTPHLYRRVVSNYTNNRSVLNEYCPYQISKVISRVLSRPRLSIPPRSRLTLTLETTGVKLLTMGFLRSSGDHVSPTGAGVRSIEDDRYVSRSRDIILRNVSSILPCLIEISNTSKIHGFASRRLLNNLSSNRKAFPAHDPVDRSVDHLARKGRESARSFRTFVFLRMFADGCGTWRIKGMPPVKWPRLEFTWNRTTWGPRSRSGIVSLCCS